MPSLALNCSVCNDSFANKADWLRHLLQERHLVLARQGLPNWGGAERACVLVVFAKLPVGRDDRIIQYLSKNFATLVTDFVWWEERPRVGFVQFETSSKLQKVLGSLQNYQFQIDQDQFCQVRDGATISELEWNELHPEIEILPEQHLHEASSSPEAPHPISTDKVTSIVPPSSEKLSSITRERLRDHLDSILKMIEIPDEEYNVILDIHGRIQEVLKNCEGNGENNVYRSALTRHWILKLKYPTKAKSSNYTPVAIFIHKEIHKFTKLEFREIQEKLFGPEEHPTLFLANQVPKLHGELNPRSRRFPSFDIETTGGLSFEMRILSSPIFLIEDQVWLLLKYLSSFDPHYYPVLALTYYWAAANVILVGETGGNPKNLPDPSGLNWLLMLFFQQEGFIPATNLILEEPHTFFPYYGIDIGFSDSTLFSRSWRIAKNTLEMDTTTETFAEEVFTLLFKFFLFCANLLRKIQKNEKFVWILSTRDSELIPISDIQTTNIRDSKKLERFKLSQDELTVIRKDYDKESYGRIVMLHPFFINWRISTSHAEHAFNAMKKTGRKLQDYFQNGGMRKREKLEFNEFLYLLKVP